MDPWEQLAYSGVDALGKLGLQFGASYANNWLAKNQAEAQLELMQQYRQAFPAPAAPNPLLLLLIVGVVVIAVAKD